jgi:5-methylcytosine-specific restriction endonuclease McrA
VTCPCGCGRTFDPVGSRGRPRAYYSPGCSLRVNNYMNTHERKATVRKPTQLSMLNPFFGRRHTDATRQAISEKASVPKPYLRGERNGMSGRTGASNPNWRGGSSPERQRLYSGAAWRQLRRQVRDRDGLHCRNCPATTSLHMHHIKPWATHPELRFELTNVILLCRDCHHNAHRREASHQ